MGRTLHKTVMVRKYSEKVTSPKKQKKEETTFLARTMLRQQALLQPYIYIYATAAAFLQNCSCDSQHATSTRIVHHSIRPASGTSRSIQDDCLPFPCVEISNLFIFSPYMRHFFR